MLNFLDFLNEAKTKERRPFSDEELGIASDLYQPRKQKHLSKIRDKGLSDKEKNIAKHSFAMVGEAPKKELTDILVRQSPIVKAIVELGPDTAPEFIKDYLKERNIEILPHKELWLKHAAISKLKNIASKTKNDEALNPHEKMILQAWKQVSSGKTLVGKGDLSPEYAIEEIQKSIPIISEDEAEIDLIKKLQNDVKNRQHVEVDPTSDKSLSNLEKVVRQSFDRFVGTRTWGSFNEPSVLDVLYNKSNDYSRDWSPDTEAPEEELKKRTGYSKGWVGTYSPERKNKSGEIEPEKKGIRIPELDDSDLPDFGASPEEGFPSPYLNPQSITSKYQRDPDLANLYKNNWELRQKEMVQPAEVAIKGRIKSLISNSQYNPKGITDTEDFLLANNNITLGGLIDYIVDGVPENEIGVRGTEKDGMMDRTTAPGWRDEVNNGTKDDPTGPELRQKWANIMAKKMMWLTHREHLIKSGGRAAGTAGSEYSGEEARDGDGKISDMLAKGYSDRENKAIDRVADTAQKTLSKTGQLETLKKQYQDLVIAKQNADTEIEVKAIQLKMAKLYDDMMTAISEADPNKANKIKSQRDAMAGLR